MSRRNQKTPPRVPAIPDYWAKCPYCRHLQLRGSWSIAHTNIDQTAQCEACGKRYEITGDKSFSPRGRAGRKMPQRVSR